MSSRSSYYSSTKHPLSAARITIGRNPDSYRYEYLSALRAPSGSAAFLRSYCAGGVVVRQIERVTGADGISRQARTFALPEDPSCVIETKEVFHERSMTEILFFELNPLDLCGQIQDHFPSLTLVSRSSTCFRKRFSSR